MHTLTEREVAVLRMLASRYAEIAALPCQNETIRLWKCLNDLHPERPMVTIDQLPWHELNFDGTLTCEVADPFFRDIERQLRHTLLQWKHFPADMVVMPWIAVPMAIESTGWCSSHTEVREAYTDPTSDVISHEYIPYYKSEDDLADLHEPVITLNEAENEDRRRVAESVFAGILPVRMVGQSTMYHPWDHLVGWLGPTEMLVMLADEPEIAHRICKIMHGVMLSELRQLEALGALESPQPLIHCTGAFTDALPKAGFDPAKPRPCDVWTAGMSQPFANVSPAMQKEFDLDYAADYYRHFGLVYYGCCEPLADRIELIRAIPNIRKISCSPWSNPRLAAEKQGADIVLSRKPNPAFLAPQSADLDSARRELAETLDACRAHRTPCELILKDVSTVHYEPRRLVEWNDMAMALVKA